MLKKPMFSFHRTLDEGSEKKVMIEKIINHPDYNSRTLNNDIALIKLKEKVELKFTPLETPDKIGVVCLPEAMKKAKIGQKCYITGMQFVFQIPVYAQTLYSGAKLQKVVKTSRFAEK